MENMDSNDHLENLHKFRKCLIDDGLDISNIVDIMVENPTAGVSILQYAIDHGDISKIDNFLEDYKITGQFHYNLLQI